MASNARALLAGMLLAAAAPALAQSHAADDDWEGLVRVPSQRIEFVYLAPGADFRPYTKVILEPSEMAMRKDWLRDYQQATGERRNGISERDVVRALERGSKRFDTYFADAFTQAGFTIVRSPAADVVRVRLGVFEIDVQTPDGLKVTRNERLTLSENAGQATLVVEVRDSVTNALLGRAIERRLADDTGQWARGLGDSKVGFNRLFRRWAEASAQGMAELKALSPVDVEGERLAR